jgi:hypothetical protein
MAKLFDSYDRIVPTWMAAAGYLLDQTSEGHKAQNLLLELNDPLTLTPEDKGLIAKVDACLRSKDKPTSIETVAATIFPQASYFRHGRPAFYEHFLDAMKSGRKPGTWGTYAMRLINRQAADGRNINPLDVIVERLKRAKAARTAFKSSYEAGLIDPSVDYVDDLEITEIPTYDPLRDRNLNRNMPCLSHLSFKINNDALDLTAMYRYHYYGERALGNLIGLARLQRFAARESGYEMGTLSCLSTYAYLDTESLGGTAASRQLLK